MPRATRQLPNHVFRVVVRATAFPARSMTEISVVCFASEGGVAGAPSSGPRRSEAEGVARAGSMLAASAPRWSAERRRATGTSTWSGSATVIARSKYALRSASM